MTILLQSLIAQRRNCRGGESWCSGRAAAAATERSNGSAATAATNPAAVEVC